MSDRKPGGSKVRKRVWSICKCSLFSSWLGKGIASFPCRPTVSLGTRLGIYSGSITVYKRHLLDTDEDNVQTLWGEPSQASGKLASEHENVLMNVLAVSLVKAPQYSITGSGRVLL